MSYLLYWQLASIKIRESGSTVSYLSAAHLAALPGAETSPPLGEMPGEGCEAIFQSALSPQLFNVRALMRPPRERSSQINCPLLQRRLQPIEKSKA